MFSSSTPVQSGRRTRGNSARQSVSRASSVAGLAALGDGGTPEPSAGTAGGISSFGARNRRNAAGSSRRASLLPGSRTPARAASKASPLPTVELGESVEQVNNAAFDSEGLDTSTQETGVLLKTETHTVTALDANNLSNIPTEIREILLNSDFYTEPYLAVLEPAIGYACLIGRQHCHVWSLATLYPSTSSAPIPPPTCYSFPVPQTAAESLSAIVLSPVPFVHLVSLETSSSTTGTSREPGLLVISGSGQCRYWNTITAALSDPERYTDMQVPLAASEVIRCTQSLSTVHYVIATSGGRLFSVKIVSPYSTSASLTYQQLTRAKGVLARVGNYFGTAAIDIRGGFSTLATRPLPANKRDGKSWQVCAMSNEQIEYWRIYDSQTELQEEQDWHSALISALRSKFVANIDVLEVSVLDSGFVDDTLVTLVSFVQVIPGKSPSLRPELSYALVYIQELHIREVQVLAFKHQPDLRPLSLPRLRISKDTLMAYVTLPDIVIFADLGNHCFEENVSLRGTASDRILGLSAKNGGHAILLAAHTGLIDISIDSESVRSVVQTALLEDPADLATKNLTRKLEQAVLYADKQHNPLAFDVTLGQNGDLVSAAEAVSSRILSNEGRLLPPIIDVRAMLADKLARLHFLMKHLHDNNLMARLSKTSRRHLAWDAEKVSASAALWQLHNSDIRESVLTEAISSVRPSSDLGDDGIRAFYQYHTKALPQVLEALRSLLQKRVMLANLALLERSTALLDIDHCLASVLKATLRHRIEFGQLYGIPLGPDSQTCLSEPWSSRPATLHLLRDTFEATVKLLQERTNVLGSTVDEEAEGTYGSIHSRSQTPSQEDEQKRQHVLKNLLVDLGDYTLAMHQERLAYLQISLDNSGATTELKTLLDTYVHIRPTIIDNINKLGRINAAFDLAERYRDFPSLVLLCNDAEHGSPARIHFFVEKYKQDFAFAWYDWLLENGRKYNLMTQDATYNNLLADYLRERQLHELSWMLEVSLDRPENAAISLLHQADAEGKLDEQKLLLSLGKLAQVAGHTRDYVETSGKLQQALAHVDTQLDIAASHDRLLGICHTAQDPRDFAKPVETQATVLVVKMCPVVQDPEQVKLASFLFRRLLLGDALYPEDLADLYSMKDNQSDEQIMDFSYALDILSRDQTTPPARSAVASKAVWRRIYLHDNWAEIRQLASSSSDEALAGILRTTSLYHTLTARKLASTPGWEELGPSGALYNSTPEEEASLQSRFSAVAYNGAINSTLIGKSYVSDSQRLSIMIEDRNVRLEELFDETVRLVRLQGQEVLSGLDDSYMQI